MEKKLTIVIVDSRAKAAARATISTLLFLIAPIALGIVMDSKAMQWAGFVLGFLLFISHATRFTSANTRHTIEEARKLLDTLEAPDDGVIGWVTVRVIPTSDGMLIHQDDLRRYGLDWDRPYKGKLEADGSYRIFVPHARGKAEGGAA